MNRRNLLATLSSSSAVGLAGCTGLVSSDSDSEAPSGGSAGPSTDEPKPDPQISSWSEDLLDGMSYRVSVTVQLNGAERLLVTKGTPGSETIATINSSGEHTVVGPDTNHGTIEAGRTLWVVRPRESSDINESVGSFFVGTQEQATFPLHLSGLSGSTDPELGEGETISREFEQGSGRDRTVLSLEVPANLDQYYRNRLRTLNFGTYVSDTYDDRYIQSIVNDFEDFGERQNLNDVGVINEMMSFVQNLQYTTDRVSAGYNEYPKYPIETLVDKEGDCEDTAILLSSMLDQFGYGSVLLIFENQQHAAVGVAGDAGIEGTYYEQDGQRYYYTETTAPNYRIGQLPPDMEVGNPEIAPVNDNGVLVFSYAVDTPSDGGASVEITMRNVGDGTGSAAAQAAFKNRNQARVVSAVSDSTQLRPGEEHTVTLNMAPPDDQALRAEVGVVMDGTLQDRLRSEYREPVNSGNMG